MEPGAAEGAAHSSATAGKIKPMKALGTTSVFKLTQYRALSLAQFDFAVLNVIEIAANLQLALGYQRSHALSKGRVWSLRRLHRKTYDVGDLSPRS
jgi:hypothetical protein